MRGIHQSRALSEMSSQFQDECSAVPGRFCIDRWYESLSARRNLVLGPLTLITGCKPMVLVTTPPQPASKARRMLLSDSVGGADESRNGLRNCRPVNVTDRFTAIAPPSSNRGLRPVRLRPRCSVGGLRRDLAEAASRRRRAGPIACRRGASRPALSARASGGARWQIMTRLTGPRPGDYLPALAPAHFGGLP